MSIYAWVGVIIACGIVGIFCFGMGYAVGEAPKRSGAVPIPNEFPYQTVPLFTEAEKKFFAVLAVAVPSSCLVFGQVRLANLVAVSKEATDFWKSFAPIGMKCVDFVIVEKESLTPLLVVELDDRSHLLLDRQRRDEFVDRVLDTIGLPILHIPAQREYQCIALNEMIMAKLATPIQLAA